MKCAGTIMSVVTRSAATSRRHSSASNLRVSTTVAPTNRCCAAAALGAVWYAGPTTRCTSCGVQPHISTMRRCASKPAAPASIGWSTPFGRPVVPEV